MKIMIVDDDKNIRDSLKSFLLALGHDVVEFENGLEALQALPGAGVSLVFSDIMMPRMTGIELVHNIAKLSLKHIPKIALFTGYGTMDSVMESLRAGAFDYLLKPVNVQDIVAVIERVNKTAQGFCLDTDPWSAGRQIIVGSSVFEVHSAVMENIIREAYVYHRERDIPVLVRGETGTGKELVSRLIHFGDGGDTRPFIDINCAAITPSLFESELFGYEGGSFTGGLAKGQKGKVDLAQGGTLFLDEITEIPIELQGKLLRFLQEKEYYRVGGLKKIESDVRIICATNRNLEKAVSEGLFRQDLYYRLKVGQLFIPPLRERKQEILPLAQSFLEKIAAHKGKRILGIGKEASNILNQYDWPGNVRELKNLMEWITVMAEGEEVIPDHLKALAVEPNEMKTNVSFLSNRGLIADKIDEEILRQALEKTHGNRAAAADHLGISRRSLYRLIDKISKPDD